jgi:hypothetical protein
LIWIRSYATIILYLVVKNFYISGSGFKALNTNFFNSPSSCSRVYIYPNGVTLLTNLTLVYHLPSDVKRTYFCENITISTLDFN